MSIAGIADSTQPPHSETSTVFRIAIVGCGPRGFHCLETLLRRLSETTLRSPIEIVIFEPTPWPGAGNVYNPNQPEYLRMNFASRYIDAWVRGDRSSVHQPTLVEWLSQNSPLHSDPNGYAPRSLVGKYLVNCFDHVLRNCSDNVSIRIVRENVADVHRCGTQWKVTPQYSSDGKKFDEVVIATGHGGLRNSNLVSADGKAFAVPVIKDVFPVETNLTEKNVPPKAVVAIRGFGLTWIDATLALTEGRGGKFETISDRLIYRFSGNEPHLILPYCRTGRPMLAKPELGKITLPKQLAAIWEKGRQQIREPEQSHSFTQSIWPAILSISAEALAIVNGNSRSTSDSATRKWFENWIGQCQSPETVVSLVQRSIDVATGQRPLDEAWALSEAWRKLYPALVDRISHGGLTNESDPDDQTAWQNFANIASEMEKIAFGPPVVNVQKMLALVDANILRFDQLTSELDPSGMFRNSDRSGLVNYDVLINAVIPSTDDYPDDSPIGKLLIRKELTRMRGCGSIAVNESGQPLDSNKNPIQGVAIFGRATEGCVLGNDTLSRRLHSHIERWATGVIANCLWQTPVSNVVAQIEIPD